MVLLYSPQKKKSNVIEDSYLKNFNATKYNLLAKSTNVFVIQ